MHIGEVEARHDEISGIAVHVASRVIGLARPGEVLVTGTVRDLIDGANLAFADQGQYALMGPPEEIRPFARLSIGSS